MAIAMTGKEEYRSDQWQHMKYAKIRERIITGAFINQVVPIIANGGFLVPTLVMASLCIKSIV